MRNPFTLIFLASKSVLTQGGVYWLWLIFFAVLALTLFVLVPVWSVPGNDVAFQLSLFTFGNWILFAVLALLIALLSTMQIFIFRRAKSLRNAATGAAGAYAGILGGVFATAACSWCVAAVLGFLGTGAVLFVAENQLWAVLVAIAMMLFSLSSASKKVVEECGCGVEPASGTKGSNNQSDAL